MIYYFTYIMYQDNIFLLNPIMILHFTKKNQFFLFFKLFKIFYLQQGYHLLIDIIFYNLFKLFYIYL